MKSFLLVDDDQICNFISTKLLQRLDLAQEIHTAGNGHEALNLIKDHYIVASTLPDIILLDLNMPVMDGFSFLEAFQRLGLPRKEEVSIIIVTSSTSNSDILRAKQMGIIHVLTKPLSEPMLLSALTC